MLRFRYSHSAPARLDQFLRAELPDRSRSRLQAQIRAGAVRVNGAPQLRPAALLAAGDQVEALLEPTSVSPATAAPEAIPLHVLYEDDDLAVINKPAGLVVHPGAGQPRGTLVNALLHRFGRLSSAGGLQRPGIVHRLDRDTTGVLVVARNDFAHGLLSAQFAARTVVKTYRALAHGIPAPAHGEIQLPIGRDRLRRVRMSTRRPAAHARTAHTSYRLLEAFPAPPATPPSLRSAARFCLLELQLHTGRTHQIRVHLSALGHPLVGDRLYGAPAMLTAPPPLAGWCPPHIMLHAASLEFDHPRSHQRLRFAAPWPADMEALAAQLRSVSGAEPTGL